MVIKNLNELHVMDQRQVQIKIFQYRLNKQKRNNRYIQFSFIFHPLKKTFFVQVDKIDSKVKPKSSGVRGRPKKQTVDPPAPPPVQQESHSPIYATIQRNTSLDRTSFATVAVNSSIVQIAPSNDTVNTTPKPSTFKRIQSFFRATPSMYLTAIKTNINYSFGIFSINKFIKS
jgi:hypothetical protein